MLYQQYEAHRTKKGLITEELVEKSTVRTSLDLSEPQVREELLRATLENQQLIARIATMCDDTSKFYGMLEQGDAV